MDHAELLAAIDPANGDDLVVPFHFTELQLRGRLVRVGKVLDDVLRKHAYPSPIAALLGETMVVAIALANTLKYDGRFTLQAKGNGAVRLLVADVTHKGEVRGYAQYDETQMESEAQGLSLLGQGHLAFTVEQTKRGKSDTYQGIVELKGASIAEATQSYFLQSEQIATALIAKVDETAGHWRGGAIMVQRVPEEGGLQSMQRVESQTDDDWHRMMLLLSTCSVQDLCAADIRALDLLYRLFNQDRVMVYAPRALKHACGCAVRIADAISLFNSQEIDEMANADGVLEMTCQFCNSVYRFTPEERAAIYAAVPRE